MQNNKTTDNKIIVLIVILELILLVYIGWKVFKKVIPYLKISIAPLQKNDLVANSNSKLKYFFEPRSNNTPKNINTWTGLGANNTINADSLNERFNYPIQKQKGTYRIITLGDSYTYGLYVDTQDNWTELLENSLNMRILCGNISMFEVINLGVPGYDIQYSVERYRLRGQKYNPDLVVWLIRDQNVNQINEIMLAKEQEFAKEMKSTGEFDRLVKQGEMYPSWKRAKEYVDNALGITKVIEAQKTILKEFNDYYHGPLVVATFPTTYKNYMEPLVGYTIERRNTYFDNTLTNIYGEPDKIFPKDGHPNKKGHEAIANNIFNYLTKKKIIPCN